MSLSQEELQRINAYWRASNYLAAGQLYLLDNPLLRCPLTRDDVKRRSLATGAPCPARTSCMCT